MNSKNGHRGMCRECQKIGQFVCDNDIWHMTYDNILINFNVKLRFNGRIVGRGFDYYFCISDFWHRFSSLLK